MNPGLTVAKDHIVVYRVLSDEYRAYIKSNPGKEVWALSLEKAVEKLKEKFPEAKNLTVRK